jgi:hypothetical protein
LYLNNLQQAARKLDLAIKEKQADPVVTGLIDDFSKEMVLVLNFIQEQE